MSWSARHLLTALASLSLLLVAAQAQAATYYVRADGDDTKSGADEANAWGTIAHAASVAIAGDTVYIKAGLYHADYVLVKNSGTEQAPIVFQGYKDTPGEVVDPQYTPGQPLNSALIPVLEGEMSTENAKLIGFDIPNRSYVEVRYIGVTRYNLGIFPSSSQHVTLDGVYSIYNGPTEGRSIMFRNCDYCTLKNSVAADGWAANIHIWKSIGSVVENTRSYATFVDPADNGTDYHIVIADSQGITVKDCSAENLHADVEGSHRGHGIGIKDYYNNGSYPNPHSEGNQIINCVGRDLGEYFYVAHEAHHNTFIGCSAFGDYRKVTWTAWMSTIILRDGAHDNKFVGFYGEGSHSGVILEDSDEGPPDQIVSNNLFVNSVFYDMRKGIELWNADDNTFQNCVFDTTGAWAFVRFPFDRVGHGNSCRNSIVVNVPGQLYLADNGSTEAFPFTYSDFSKNSFAMPAGEGNLDQDPLFANPAKKDYHVKSQQGRWDGATSSWVKDAESSPCIDTGSPVDDYSAEPCPNGARINMGAYGNTAQASMSSSTAACVNNGGSAGAAGSGGNVGPAGAGGSHAGSAGVGGSSCGCRSASRRGSSLSAMLVVVGAALLRRRRSARAVSLQRAPVTGTARGPGFR